MKLKNNKIFYIVILVIFLIAIYTAFFLKKYNYIPYIFLFFIIFVFINYLLRIIKHLINTNSFNLITLLKNILKKLHACILIILILFLVYEFFILENRLISYLLVFIIFIYVTIFSKRFKPSNIKKQRETRDRSNKANKF